MTNIDRLEQFWHDLVRLFPETVDFEGAIVAHSLQTPMVLFNHVTNINVTEDRAEVFLKKIINHFSSVELPFACFRVSPLTPPTFISLLESHGFERESEQSVMVFEGKAPINKPGPSVTVNETGKDDVDAFSRLMLTNFEMPLEWRSAVDKLVVDIARKGARNYLAYSDGQPVGTTSLFSNDKTGCILNVSTLKEYRKRGIGTELTIHALSDSFKIGNDLHTLQTEKGGDAEKLYRKIGFRIDHTVSFFVKKL